MYKGFFVKSQKNNLKGVNKNREDLYKDLNKKCKGTLKGHGKQSPSS